MRVLSLRAFALPILVALALLQGCATTGESGASSRDTDVVTEEELREVFVSDLYQVVELLRPLWLQSRGVRSLSGSTEIAVIRDGAYFGDITQLRSIPSNQVTRLEYIDGAAAAARIPGLVGSNRVVEAAILVTLGRPR